MTSDISQKKARPWLRRISYILAGGVVVGAGGVWFAHSATMQRVYIRAIASVVKEETGLEFDAEGLDFSILKRRARLYAPSLGPELFRADEIDVAVNIRSFIGGMPHIRNVRVVNPVTNISNEILGRIRLKPSEGPSSNINWRLDRLEISNGSLFISEPEWGIPSAEVRYRINARGAGPRKLHVETVFPKMAYTNEFGTVQGNARILADVEADVIRLRQLDIDGEPLKLKASGTYNLDNEDIQCEASGSIFSRNLIKFLGEDYSGFDGQIDFSGTASGNSTAPAWTFRLNARDFKTPYKPFDNCGIEFEAQGDASEISIKQLELKAKSSALTVQGELKDSGCSLLLNGVNLSLRPLSEMARTPLLSPVVADIRGTFSSSVPVWNDEILSRFNIGLSTVFRMDGNEVGNLTIAAAKNSLHIESLKLKIPDLTIFSTGTIGFKADADNTGTRDFSLTSIDIDAKAVTTAEQVAYSLDKWDIVDRLPVSGSVNAGATITWTPTAGFGLTGSVGVDNPVYYGATADNLATDVRIETEQLFLDNIILNRKEATANGQLWLTWADVPLGADQISMRYESHGLPLSEGLNAGIEDIEILEDMAATGLVDGWVTIGGPFDDMVMNGEARLYNDASIYGISIPAFFGSFGMNLGDSNFNLTVPEFRLADCHENLDTLEGPLGLRGNLEMDLISETWRGRVTGVANSHVLGLTNLPQMSARVDAVLDGPYAADYGYIYLPEGTVSLSNGSIIIHDDDRADNRLDGLLCDLSLKNGQLLGKIRFSDFKESKESLIELDARKEDESLRTSMRMVLSPATAHTDKLAKAFTDGAVEDIRLDMSGRGRLAERGLTWRADVETLAGNVFGQYFEQQRMGTLDVNSERIKLSFDIGSKDSDSENSETLSWLRVEGTLPVAATQKADLGFVGTVDLKQTKYFLAGVFRESPDVFLSGFTPIGVGIMDLKLHGPYDALALDGALKINGARLMPRNNFPYGIENLDVDLICRERQIKLENLQGRMARGKLTGNGEASWNNDGLENYQFHTKLDDFHYHFIPEGFQLSGSLDAHLYSLKDSKTEIKGTLSATNMAFVAEIDLAKMILDTSVGSIPSLQNIELDDPLDNISLNLDVELAQPWSFDTNLMKFKGMPSDKFKILGTLARPGLRGRMEFVPGGRITNILPAGDIIIEKGSIDFPDPNVFNPVLDLQGQIDISPFRVNLSIQGPLDSINMVPTSTPSLRQDEVISILLNPAMASTMGNSAYSNSMSSSAATSGGLADTAGGLITNLMLTSIQERFRRALGLDRVSVAWRAGMGGSGNIETDIIIGKNINMNERTIPVMGSYKKHGDMVTIGGQLEWRIGNLVIHLGASGSRTLSATPSGEIRYTWSSW